MSLMSNSFLKTYFQFNLINICYIWGLQTSSATWSSQLCGKDDLHTLDNYANLHIEIQIVVGNLIKSSSAMTDKIISLFSLSYSQWSLPHCVHLPSPVDVSCFSSISKSSLSPELQPHIAKSLSLNSRHPSLNQHHSIHKEQNSLPH